MSNDKLIDDILELVIGDMCCHHESSLDEDGPSISAEYSFYNETKVRGMIGEMIEEAEERPKVSELFMEKWAIKLSGYERPRDLIFQMLKEAGVEIKDG